ncbi:MAG: fatty acid desaturase CarF family protein [Anaeromyxobacter sp.]
MVFADAAWLAVRMLGALVLVDLVSGLVHWAEDTFWTEDTPVLGRWIVRPNVLHHQDGAAFVSKGWWASSWDLALAGAVIVGVAWWAGALTAPVWLFAVVGANANQLHKWTHVPASRVPGPVRWLMRARVLQDARHHGAHHRGEKNTAYCVVTPWVNPVLDRMGFWRALERAVVRRAPRRADLGWARG